ncbi:hypothetical protein CL621_00295 [archaeon]|nr:hypothetical protein [archaeon]|tara:strand:- start:3470 stop:4123 length:654 start_codon:yes stop_codon:yes gene_type:complete
MNQIKVDEILSILRKSYKKKSMLGSIKKKSPFYILISTILSIRNRDENTIKVVKNLFSKYKSIKSLANANIKDLERTIKKSGFYKIKAKRIKEVSRILLEEYNGQVPNTLEELIKLPGVGPKVAACTLVYAFNEEEIPVDIHVEVISKRLGWTEEKTANKIWVDLKNKLHKKYWLYINELFVLHGKEICLTRSPKCNICPISIHCSYYSDTYSLKSK